jgi:hypothetical protein
MRRPSRHHAQLPRRTQGPFSRGCWMAAAAGRNRGDHSWRRVRLVGFVALALACVPSSALGADSATLATDSSAGATGADSTALPPSGETDGPQAPAPTDPPASPAPADAATGDAAPAPLPSDSPVGQPSAGPGAAEPPPNDSPSDLPPSDGQAGEAPPGPGPADRPPNDPPGQPPSGPPPADPAVIDRPAADPAPPVPTPASRPTARGLISEPTAPSGTNVAIADRGSALTRTWPAAVWTPSSAASSGFRLGSSLIDSRPTGGWLPPAAPVGLPSRAPWLEAGARVHTARARTASSNTTGGRQASQPHPPPWPADSTEDAVAASAASGAGVPPAALSCAIFGTRAAPAAHELRRVRAQLLAPDAPGVPSLRDRPG